MEIKKSKKARLELHSKTFFLIGLAISLTIVLYAFEYKSEAKRMEMPESTTVIDWNEAVIENTERPKPKQKVPKVLMRPPIVVDNSVKTPDNDLIVYSDEIDKLGDLSFEESEYKEDTEIFIEFPSEKPEFPGGDQALQMFLHNNIQYPQMAIDYGSEGTVYVEFVVGSNGAVRDIKILREVDQLLEEEAIRVIKSMPRWKPAKQGINSVATYMRLPIKFTLNR